MPRPAPRRALVSVVGWATLLPLPMQGAEVAESPVVSSGGSNLGPVPSPPAPLPFLSPPAARRVGVHAATRPAQRAPREPASPPLRPGVLPELPSPPAGERAPVGVPPLPPRSRSQAVAPERSPEGAPSRTEHGEEEDARMRDQEADSDAGDEGAVGAPPAGNVAAPGAPPLPAQPVEQRVSLAEAIAQAYTQDLLFNDREYTADLEMEDGLWLNSQGQVLVPNVPALRQRIIAEHHDSPHAGHRGVLKTTELVERHFAWATLRGDVQVFVDSCDACQRHKASTQRAAGLLQPLPVPSRPWESVGCDLWVKLPPTPTGHDSVLVVTCRLSKYVHLIATTEKMTAAEFWRLLHERVICEEGWPHELVTDRGSQFTSEYMQEVCRLAGCKHRLSTAYHPQTNGQTERVNRVLGEVLRTCVRDARDANWVDHLPDIQFALNNSWREAIGTTPFFLCRGQHPRTPALRDVPVRVAPAASFVRRHDETVRRARQLMERAQEQFKEQADKRRRHVTFQVGDLVLLSTANMALTGVRKLMPRYVGPFAVAEMVNDLAVRLQLPPSYQRMHATFHVSLLSATVCVQVKQSRCRRLRRASLTASLSGRSWRSWIIGRRLCGRAPARSDALSQASL